MSNLYYSVIISVLILKALWNLHGSCAPTEAGSFLTAAVHCFSLSGLLPSSSHPGHAALLWLNIWSSRPAISLLRLSPPFFFPPTAAAAAAAAGGGGDEGGGRGSRDPVCHIGMRATQTPGSDESASGPRHRGIPEIWSTFDGGTNPTFCGGCRALYSALRRCCSRIAWRLSPPRRGNEGGGIRRVRGPSGGSILGFFRGIIRREAQARL